MLTVYLFRTSQELILETASSSRYIVSSRKAIKSARSVQSIRPGCLKLAVNWTISRMSVPIIQSRAGRRESVKVSISHLDRPDELICSKLVKPGHGSIAEGSPASSPAPAPIVPVPSDSVRISRKKG